MKFCKEKKIPEGDVSKVKKMWRGHITRCEMLPNVLSVAIYFNKHFSPTIYPNAMCASAHGDRTNPQGGSIVFLPTIKLKPREVCTNQLMAATRLIHSFIQQRLLELSIQAKHYATC